MTPDNFMIFSDETTDSFDSSPDVYLLSKNIILKTTDKSGEGFTNIINGESTSKDKY